MMRPEKIAWILLVALSAICPALSEQKTPEMIPALENELLRNYFRQLYPAGRAIESNHPPSFLETWVDQQIRSFLSEIDKKATALSDHLTLSEKLRLRILDLRQSGQGQSSPVYREALHGFREELGRVEKAADSLRSQVGLVLNTLSSRKRLEYEFDPDRRTNFFSQETAFIRTEVDASVQRIRDYLFGTDNTVSLEDLQGQNMLVRLYWAREVAKQIREELE